MICPICGQFVDVIVRSYSEEPFIDGRYYDMMCFICATIPKIWEQSANGTITWYKTKSPDRLMTVKEMVNEGWGKREVEKSLRAIKKALKNPRVIIVSELEVNVFDCLFFGDSTLYEVQPS
jgi:hypothetical protein